MSKSIAIIDDEPEMEFYYKFLFDKEIEDHLLEIHYFQDPKSFLEWLPNNNPDLILSDIDMPYISGPELCRQLRSEGQSIPIYFVSGYDEQDFHEILSDLGLCRYVSKPFNPARFKELIELDLNLPLP